MKRIAGLAWIVLAVSPLAWAEEETPNAPLNDPKATVETVKRIVNMLNPSYETVWLLSDKTFSQGVSASLFNITSEEIPIASIRLGFGTNENLYAGPSLDLPGIARRYIPQTVKGIATAGPLDLLWSAVGAYARVGVVGGYSWSEEKAIYGVTAGAALSF